MVHENVVAKQDGTGIQCNMQKFFFPNKFFKQNLLNIRSQKIENLIDFKYKLIDSYNFIFKTITLGIIIGLNSS